MVIRFTVNIRRLIVCLYVFFAKCLTVSKKGLSAYRYEHQQIADPHSVGLYASYQALLAYCSRAKANKTAPEVIIRSMKTLLGLSLTYFLTIFEK